MNIATIDLNRLSYNLNNIKKMLPNKTIIAVIKADAYGHGLIEIAKHMEKNGISFFGVANICEAIKLRDSGVTSNILIFGHTPIEKLEYILKYDLIQTIYSVEYANIFPIRDNKFRVHIKLDTGMNRLGFKVHKQLLNNKTFNEVVKLYNDERFKIEGLFSHFSSIEDEKFTKEQFEKYSNFVTKLEDININVGIKHISNSYSVIKYPQYILDGIRIGLLWTGVINEDKFNLKPILSLTSKIVHINNLKKDEYVGYNKTYVSNEELKVGIIPYGYADGNHMTLSNNDYYVTKNGKVHVVGNISMDMTAILLNELDDIGDEVLIFGENHLGMKPITITSGNAKTISYEILTSIGRRVEFIYIK